VDITKEQLSDYDELARKYPVMAVMKPIGGKWKILILWQLKGKVLRFSDLERSLPKITQAMLTQQLRSLEKDVLIKRKVYHVVPPKVEYSLTPLGTELPLAFEALEVWGNRFICKELEN
jgi:DNA-binding HxlR family transcriptional regulator